MALSVVGCRRTRSCARSGRTQVTTATTVSAPRSRRGRGRRASTADVELGERAARGSRSTTRCPRWCRTVHVRGSRYAGRRRARMCGPRGAWRRRSPGVCRHRYDRKEVETRWKAVYYMCSEAGPASRHSPPLSDARRRRDSVRSGDPQGEPCRHRRASSEVGVLVRDRRRKARCPPGRTGKPGGARDPGAPRPAHDERRRTSQRPRRVRPCPRMGGVRGMMRIARPAQPSSMVQLSPGWWSRSEDVLRLEGGALAVGPLDGVANSASPRGSRSAMTGGGC